MKEDVLLLVVTVCFVGVIFGFGFVFGVIRGKRSVWEDYHE